MLRYLRWGSCSCLSNLSGCGGGGRLGVIGGLTVEADVATHRDDEGEQGDSEIEGLRNAI